MAQHLAQVLSVEKHNVSFICPRQELLKVVETQSDLMTYHGDSTSIRLLEEVNPKKKDLLISVHRDGRLNLLTAILAKKLGVKKCIAKLHDAEALSPEYKDLCKSLGIDFLVSPEKIASKEIVNLLNNTAATEIFDFTDKQLSLMLVKLEANAPVVGKSLNEIANLHKHLDFRAVAIHRLSKTIIPKGNDVFMEGDMAYVITKPDGIEQLLEMGGKKRFTINNVMIVGGGTVGAMTSAALEQNFRITLFDLNYERCQELNDLLSNTLVVNGDARDIKLLHDENIDKMDAFVAVTNNSETNILTCLLARKLGVKKTIALVENLDFIEISRNIGIDTIINKKLATASYIIRFTMSAEVVSTKCLTGIEAEVFEFVAKPESPVTKKAIRKLKFPEKAIIGGIIREGHGFIAMGDFQIRAGDRVVVFALPQAFHEVDKMFRN